MLPSALALYPEPPKLPVEVEPLQLDPECARCGLCRTRRKDALPGELGKGAEGHPTVLVVGDGPTGFDDAEGRVFRGRDGTKLRPMLRKLWLGDIVLDVATRCFGGRGDSKVEVLDEHIAACRPHLASTIAAAQPDRIVAMGWNALYSLTGRSLSPLNFRRGYTWLWNDGNPVPVFFLMLPGVTHRNRFLARYFEEDLKWALTAKVPKPKHLEPGFFTTLVTSPADAVAAVEDLQRGDGFAFDLEWAGYLWDPEFRLLALAASPVGRATVWAWDEEALNDPARWEPLRALLEDPEVDKGGSNVKADQHALWCGKGIRVKGISFDTRLQRKLLEADAPANLEDMAELVGMGGHKAEAQRALDLIEAHIKKVASKVKARRESKQTSMDFTESVDSAYRLGFDMEKYAEQPLAIAYAFLKPETRMRYVSRDAMTTARLASLLSLRLRRAPERQRIWEKVVLPAASAIQRVEEWGVPFDPQAGALFGDLSRQARQAAHEKVQQYALPGTKELNPDSPQQLAKVLFDRLGLDSPFQTDSGAPSTDEEALTYLRGKHPLPGYILEYRHYQKLVGYAEDWARCYRADGRIHPSIHLDGARSGRTSCSNPNLQNIPRAADSEDGKMARDCFRAPPGYVLVQLDYSQLELRIAALLANDTVMADLFRSGIDFHMGTAHLICEMAWGIKADQCTKVHRTGAKAFNFGIAYGKTDRSLAAELGISEERAAQIRKAIFGKFVRYGEWCREAIGYTRAHGGCWTMWEGERARWRPLLAIGDDTEEGAFAASKAKNGAINCLDGETEALTQRGWVRGFDLTMADKLLTKNPTTGRLEWQAPTDLRMFPDHEGTVVEFKSKAFHAVSTLDHRWLVRDKYSGRDVEKTTRTLSPWGDHRIHRTGDYRPDHKSALTPDEAELLGWFVTDGSQRLPRGKGKRKDRRAGPVAFLHQSLRANAGLCARIEMLLARLGGGSKCSVTKEGTYATWRLPKGLSVMLHARAPQRTLTVGTLLDLDREALERLREAMLLGDGTLGAKEVLCTGRQEQAEAFQVLCTLTGSASSIVWRDMSSYQPRSPKMGNVPRMNGVWLVTILRRDTVQVTHEQRREYTGKVPVWCPVVPNTFFVARRSGKVFITGNTPIQGTASEFCIASLSRLVKMVDAGKLDAQVILPIHDSIALLCPKKTWKDSALAAREAMTDFPWCTQHVPLEVDVELGTRWGSLEKVELN